MAILDQFSLNGKVALVSGAARGLGQAMAIGLAEAGADVIVLDREECDQTTRSIMRLGRRCMTNRFDLSRLDNLNARKIIADGISMMGRVDILLNNAGIIRRSAAIHHTQVDWEEVLQINLNSTFYLSQAMAKPHIERGSRAKIINVASMLSFQGGVKVPSYTASKSAVLGLTKALSNEWAQYKINVNAIAPGYLSTEVTAGIRSDPDRSKNILDRIPANRWGLPEDLKGVVVFLASNASNYLNGSIVPVDGGWLGR